MLVKKVRSNGVIRDLLFELVQIPGPSGFEGRVARRLVALLKDHVDEVSIDKIGNVVALKRGTEGKHSLAIAAHMDQLSMAVIKVDDFVWFDRVGYLDFQSLYSQPVLILGREKDVPGVVCATSAHFHAGEKQPLWIDVGDRQKYVSPGDPIIFDHPPRWLDDEKTILASPSIDDRIGCAAMVEAARSLKKRPRHNIYFIGSVQEEIGSFGIRYFLRDHAPDWLIAVDTCFAQDAVTDIKKLLPLRQGLGILRFTFTRPDVCYPSVVNYSSDKLNDRLIAAGKTLGIPVPLCAVTGSFNDACISNEVRPETEATYLLMARRYSHSPHEIVDINSGENAAKVLLQAIADSDKWQD